MEKLQRKVTPPNKLNTGVYYPTPFREVVNDMPVTVKHVDEIKAELETVRARKEARKPERDKRDWYGLVYCDPNGWASIVGDNLEGIWLGRTDEIIPYLRSRRINGQNIDMVLQAVSQLHSKRRLTTCRRRNYCGIDGCVPLPAENVDGPSKANKESPSEKKSHSCHLATENGKGHIIDHPARSIVATFGKDPRFMKLLRRLISQDKGIRAIHSEFKNRGYEVPMRTLGRWVKKRRDS
jgi:hypothetical protein